MSQERKVKLKILGHDEIFEVDEAVAQESQILKHLIEDVGVENPIPIPNVSRKILVKVIQFCKYHVEAVKKSENNPTVAHNDEIKRWDQNFVKVDQQTLLDLINAANYLNIKKLLELCCQTVAKMLENLSPQQIRKAFNIENDLTPVQEEEIRREGYSYSWEFDKEV